MDFETVELVLKAWTAYDWVKLGVLAAVAIVGIGITLFISRQVGKLTALTSSISKSAEAVGEIENQIRDLAPTIENAAATTADAVLKIVDRAKEIESGRLAFEETLVQIGKAANNLQVVRAEISEQLKLIEQNEHYQTFLTQRTHADSGTSQIATQTTDYWNEISDVWSEAKEYLESKVQGITDGRRLRKYSDITRHNYVDLINALEKDGGANGGLSTKGADIAKQLNSLFHKHKTRRQAVTQAERDAFDDLFRKLTGRDDRVSAPIRGASKSLN